MDSDVLSAILDGVLINENTKEVCAKTLPLLAKALRNAGSNPSEEKYKRLKASLPVVKSNILDVRGATEFLDACGFVVESATGDLVLAPTASKETLLTAAALVESSLEGIIPAAGTTKSASSTAASAASAPKRSEADLEYEARKREAEARAAEIRKKTEEDRLAKEKIRKAIKNEQVESHSRPVVASHRVEAPHRDHQTGGGGGGGVTSVGSEREFDKAVNSDQSVLVQFTATWCGPCKMISPMIEKLPSEFPSLRVLKVDIDDHQELAQRAGVRGVPHFVMYKKGRQVGQVTGADFERVKDIVRQGL